MTRTRIFSLLIMMCIGVVFSNAQNSSSEDPILFTVNGEPVKVSEFNYIYTKTNGPKANFSKASLEEYLDLYEKFKLKVQKAKEMQLDTIPSLQKELEGYRRQLANSYLVDREVTDRLVEEAYQHSLQDVDISHILVSLSGTGQDTSRAFQRITEAKTMLEMGEPFDSVAVRYSDDKSAKSNFGHVGYVTAIFPKGLYNMEKAAYTGPENTLIGPIRTDAGYHLMIVHGRRPARGEVECAHILIRKSQEVGVAIDAKGIIDSIYQALQKGANFEELAMARSDDKRTGAKGGNIGVFGINRFEKSFEDAAFSLKKEGEYSKPFETSAGWHIIKLISKRPVGTYDIVKPSLMAKVKNDSRFDEAQKAMIERIKKENGFREFNTTLDDFIDTLPENFQSWLYKAPEEKSKALLFVFGSKYQVSLGDFAEYLENSKQKRARMGSNDSPQNAVYALYSDFVEYHSLKFEEQQLEVKYPEFKALMREYEEGILLFEVTKMVVWDKAAQDTVGLEKFFKTIEGKYKWQERADLSIYSLKSDDPDLLDKVQKFASKNTPEEVLKKFNTSEDKPILVQGTRAVEKGRSKLVEDMPWQVGAYSKPEVNEREKSQNFVVIDRIIPPVNKTLAEARGYVIADYQDFLEKEWVEQLKKEYPIKVNQEVFRSMIK
ncbi:MAG: peptidylprolyl isomerase [Saprospirales bacterium]|nr:peptidylprolyl isomerase [Saprospirales bacterium]MBK8491599.1 peptidylprolyl isomerase [Saprospirales bacterium]